MEVIQAELSELQREVIGMKYQWDLMGHKLDALIARKVDRRLNHRGIQGGLEKLTNRTKSMAEDVKSFEAQTVKHQDTCKTESKKMLKEMETIKAKLDGMNNRLSIFDEKVKHLEKEFEASKKDIASLKASSASSPSPSSGMSRINLSEWELRERKKANVIIFGLPEVGDDNALIESLFHDLDIPFDTNSSIQTYYRIGRPNDAKKRPIVIKLMDTMMKNEILFKAKNLKGNEKWKQVGITHDLTKMECLDEKNRELQMRQAAAAKNAALSEEQKNTKCWKVIGGRGRRHVALVTCA